MDNVGLSLLTLLRDVPLHAVEMSPGASCLVFGPGDLVDRLDAKFLRVAIDTAEPLQFQPWFGGTAMPLGDALARVKLMVTGYATEDDRNGLLLLAAMPGRETPSGKAPFNGGAVHLSASAVHMQTDYGTAIDAMTLRRAAALRVGSQLVSSSVTDLRRRLGTILAVTIHPLLKAAGFRVTTPLSYRIGDTVTHFVEPTYSRFNTAIELGFDFNLGACFGDFPGGKITRQRLITDGFPAIVRPIGTLWNRSGFSYAFRPDTDADALGQRLLHDFAEYVLPWFRGLDSAEAMVTFLDREDVAKGGHANAEFAAVLLARMGKVDDARRCFRMADGLPAATARMAERYGVQVDKD
jgi:hypothetical protein